MEEQENRRRAFRLEDEILLKVERLEALEPAIMEAEFHRRRAEYGVVTHLKYGVEKHLPTMRTIERKYPEIAHYLKFLESQLQHIFIRDQEVNNAELDLDNKQMVSLSASGMSFYSPEIFKEGEYVQAKMVLFPDDLQIMALTRVSRVDSEHTGMQQVSVNFSYLHIEDKEALIKHLHKRQFDGLRKDKDN